MYGLQTFTEELKHVTVYAIAELVSDRELNAEYIIPNLLDKRVAQD
jgi:malic enzyme